MAKAYPTAERLRELLDYDQTTGVFTWSKNKPPPKQGRNLAGHIAGTIGDRGYVKINIGGSIFRAHRLAWIYCNGDDGVPEQIDHIDGDKLNNRISNLRPATQAQNNQNRAHQRGPNSLGASFVKGKWRARIKVNGKGIFLGHFNSKEDAHAAYAKAKTLYHTYNPTVPDRVS